MKHSLLKYTLIRLILGIFSLFVILLCNFLLLDYLDINPFKEQVAHYSQTIIHNSSIMVSQINEEFINDMGAYYHVNQSFISRFITLATNYVKFNLGESLYYQESVYKLIIDHIGISLHISIYSIIIMYVASGCLAYALRRTSHFVKNSILSILLLLYIIPTLVSAIFLSKHFYFPMLCAILSNCIGGVFFQTTLILKLQKQHENQIYHKFLNFNNQHSPYLKNILYILFADLASTMLALFVSSSVFVEIIFNVNGIGTLTYNAFLNKDYPLILGIIFFISTLGLVFRIMTDLLYNFIYPNIKLNQR